MGNIQICPRCNFRFDVGYGRVTACADCAESAHGKCEYVKCPNCGEEFLKLQSDIGDV